MKGVLHRTDTLLYQNSIQVSKILHENPALQECLKQLLNVNLDAVKNILRGKKSTLKDIDGILRFLDRFAIKLSPELKQNIMMVKNKLIKSREQKKQFLGFELE